MSECNGCKWEIEYDNGIHCSSCNKIYCKGCLWPDGTCEECELAELAKFLNGLKVGDLVWDNLTKKNCKIEKMDALHGVWIESDYLGGGRFTWEISPPIELCQSPTCALCVHD